MNNSKANVTPILFQLDPRNPAVMPSPMKYLGDMVGVDHFSSQTQAACALKHMVTFIEESITSVEGASCLDKDQYKTL